MADDSTTYGTGDVVQIQPLQLDDEQVAALEKHSEQPASLLAPPGFASWFGDWEREVDDYFFFGFWANGQIASTDFKQKVIWDFVVPDLMRRGITLHRHEHVLSHRSDAAPCYGAYRKSKRVAWWAAGFSAPSSNGVPYSPLLVDHNGQQFTQPPNNYVRLRFDDWVLWFSTNNSRPNISSFRPAT
jgi:hypothetical protein